MLTAKQIKERAEIVCIEGHLITDYELIEKLQAENEALEKDVFRLKMRVEQLEKAYKEACSLI